MARDGDERGQLLSTAPGSAETANDYYSSDGIINHHQNIPQQQQQQGSNSPANYQLQQQQQQYSGGDQTALFNMLRAQVEYYFSPQNLGRDNYLRNMLSDPTSKRQHQPPPPQNLQLMIPIEVISNFPKVWNICASFGAATGMMMPEPPPVLLGRALQGSAIVTISQDGAWIGPTSQQLPPFTGSAPPSPSPSQGPPVATIAAGRAPPQFPNIMSHSNNNNMMSPYPPPQMVMIPMQQPDGTIVHQSFPHPYYIRPPPPPPPNSNNNNRPLTAAGSESPSSASLEDAGSIPSHTNKESSKISVASAQSAASLSSLSEQPSQVQMMQAHQQQQYQSQYGGPMMMGQQPPGGYPMSPLPPQQFVVPPPYAVPMPPYPPYYNPQQLQQMYPPNFMPPPPGVRYGGPGGGGGGGPPPPPPHGYPSGNGPPPPYPYPGMMPPPPAQQFVGDGYPPPHPYGYPPRHQPNVGDNRKGGGGGGSFDGQKKHQDGYNNNNKKKKNNKNNNFDRKRSNDHHHHQNFGQQQNYGGSVGSGSAPSSPHFNNRYQKQHAKKGGQVDGQPNNGDRKETVLNPFDFPGLDGNTASTDSSQQKASTASDQKLVGYASALLKKNEKGNDNAAGKATAAAAVQPVVTSPENEDGNTITQQTEAMEKEILSEFHDLSIRGNDQTDNYDNIDNKQYDAHVTPTVEDKTDGYTVETSPSSTDNGVASPQSTNNGNSLLTEPTPKTLEATPTPKQIPRVDLEEREGSAPSPAVEQQKLVNDNKVDDNQEQNTEVEKPKAKQPAAWGAKRLFADVVASQNK